METELESILNRARNQPQEKWTALMHHFSVANLGACFRSLDGKKAIGVDGVTKDDYGLNLEVNLTDLVSRMKRMAYQPQPVRRVDIPKEDGTSRHLGICATEDKIVQEMARRLLEAMYEPTFMETSYGFRPGRNCHDALGRLELELMARPTNWVVDLDLRQCLSRRRKPYG